MKYIIILLLGCVPFLSTAQNPIFMSQKPNGDALTDDAGRRVALRTELNTEGSPFYADNYCMANLKIRKGKYYTGLKVKLNLQKNIVLYVDKDGQELEATAPIDKIEFINCTDPSKNQTFISGLPGIDKQDSSSFYIQLDSGNASLLKYISVNDRSMTNYGSPDIKKVYEQKEVYYSYIPGKRMTRLHKNNKGILQALSNKKAELAEFMAKNDITCRNEDELVKVFAYYNSLK